MPGMLSDFEAYMVKSGFAKRDLGNALGVFFAENWMTATKQKLSDDAEASVVRSVGGMAGTKCKAKFVGMAPVAKEKTYESVLMGTLLLGQFVQVYEKAGKTQEEAAMRRAGAALFQKVVGVAAADVNISADGKITSALPKEQASPPADMTTPDVTTPDAEPSTPGKGNGKPGPQSALPGRGVKPSQVAGVYCQPSYGGGAGGFVSVSYEPVLALKDGTYCAHFEVPPVDLDAAASRRTNPRQWGRWRSVGNRLEKQDAKGHWESAGWIGPLPNAQAGQALSGTYKNVSGGGTAAFGGDVFVALEKRITFKPNGRFQSENTASSTSSTVAVGSNRVSGGTYKISGNMIVMRFQDGTTKRWSYARTADGLVFLHGDAYTTDD